MNLDLVAGQPEATLLQPRVSKPFTRSLPWNVAAFLALWEIQSQLATIAYVGLVAFTSWYVTLGAMLVWSLTATFFFWQARERGYPNILNSVKCPHSEAGVKVAWHAVTSVFSAVLGGVHAFIYTRCTNALLNDQPAGRPRRFLRRLVLTVEHNCGETRDEHDLEIGIDFAGAARQLDAVHLGHDDIGQQKREWLPFEALVGILAVFEGDHVIIRFFKRLDEETAHGIVILCKQDAAQRQA